MFCALLTIAVADAVLSAPSPHSDSTSFTWIGNPRIVGCCSIAIWIAFSAAAVNGAKTGN